MSSIFGAFGDAVAPKRRPEQQVAQSDDDEHATSCSTDSLDDQQDQFSKLRTQIGSLMTAVAGINSEMNNLKSLLSKDIDSVMENMVASHDGHDQKHAAMFERLDCIENLLCESAYKHGEHEKHKVTTEETLARMQADFAVLAQVQAELSGGGSVEHDATMEERVNYIESFLGESADKHEKKLKDDKAGWEDHKVNMETRLEYLEALAGDSAEKHAKELEAAMKHLNNLHAAVSTCAKAEQHSSMEKRMEYLENILGESADQHDSHKATIDNRLEYVEALLGDSAEKHGLLSHGLEVSTKEIDAAKAQLDSLDQAINSCAKAEHHGNLEQRVNDLERCLGDHSWWDIGDISNTLNSHKSMQQRLEHMERTLAENSDGKAKDLTMKMEFVEIKIRDLAQKIGQARNETDGLQEDTTRQQDEFKQSIHMSIKEHMDTLNSAITNQSSQMKELWDRESMSRQHALDKYKQLLQQERTSRDALASSLEERMLSIERAMGAEPPKVVNNVSPRRQTITTYPMRTTSPRPMSPRVSPSPPRLSPSPPRVSGGAMPTWTTVGSASSFMESPPPPPPPPPTRSLGSASAFMESPPPEPPRPRSSRVSPPSPPPRSETFSIASATAF